MGGILEKFVLFGLSFFNLISKLLVLILETPTAGVAFVSQGHSDTKSKISEDSKESLNLPAPEGPD